VGDVADHGEQGRVHHRRAGTHQHGGQRPGAESGRGGDQGDADRLQQHAAGDQPLAAPPVGQGAGGQLADAPHRRIQRHQHADAAHAQAGGGEQYRVQAPGQAVVEVVDQPGLAGRRQRPLPQRCQREDLPPGEPDVRVGVDASLVPGMLPGLADEHSGQSQAEGGVRQSEQERRRPQPVRRGQGAGRQAGRREGQVAGGLVETHGQTAPVRADQVDLHDDGGGPGQALVDAQQDVRGDDPTPRGRPDQQQRHR